MLFSIFLQVTKCYYSYFLELLMLIRSLEMKISNSSSIFFSCQYFLLYPFSSFLTWSFVSSSSSSNLALGIIWINICSFQYQHLLIKSGYFFTSSKFIVLVKELLIKGIYVHTWLSFAALEYLCRQVYLDMF